MCPIRVTFVDGVTLQSVVSVDGVEIYRSTRKMRCFELGIIDKVTGRNASSSGVFRRGDWAMPLWPKFFLT